MYFLELSVLPERPLASQDLESKEEHRNKISGTPVRTLLLTGPIPKLNIPSLNFREAYLQKSS